MRTTTALAAAEAATTSAEPAAPGRELLQSDFCET